ncbi:MAG: glycoside hydrolase family 25 protein [Gemmatimonadetes bacterium]|nr:glycoside hydrolase family 25 protein [Gemmatimonadota bacterium]
MKFSTPLPLRRVVPGALALLALAAGTVLRADTPRRVPGIDVSHHQGTINWTAVKRAGIRFAFIKATEGGDWTDPAFAGNWRRAREAGVMRGAYHYYRPQTHSAVQARHFLRRVSVGRSDLPPVLDVEATDGVSNATLRRGVRNWLRTVEAETGKRPIIYVSRRFAPRLAAEFSDYPLWIADYRGGAPAVPRGWRRWTFWQHSERGRVSGIRTPVDRNWFRGTLEELRRFAHRS